MGSENFVSPACTHAGAADGARIALHHSRNLSRWLSPGAASPIFKIEYGSNLAGWRAWQAKEITPRRNRSPICQNNAGDRAGSLAGSGEWGLGGTRGRSCWLR